MATLIQTLRNSLMERDLSVAVETKRILLKEILQAYVLDFVYNHPTYRRLNFYGGTCLHVVYDLNRLSEDLDFDNSTGLDLTTFSADLVKLFQNAYEYRETSAKAQRSEQGILRVTLKFPLLNALGLSPRANEALHLKVEISHHPQVAMIQHTPVFAYGRSYVPAHFSLETMMAGKMLACLERSFQRGTEGALIKGRDFYDLLWFMQKGIYPLAAKLASDGETPYTLQSAITLLGEKVASIRIADLAVDLLPMFESRAFIESWLEHFHANFQRYSGAYFDARK